MTSYPYSCNQLVRADVRTRKSHPMEGSSPALRQTLTHKTVSLGDFLVTFCVNVYVPHASPFTTSTTLQGTIRLQNIFHLPKLKLCSPQTLTPVPPARALETPNLSASARSDTPGTSRRWNHARFVPCVCPISLCTMPSRLSPVGAGQHSGC